MTNNLSEVMNATDPTSNSLSFDSIQPGLVCCAYPDDQWYRVLVLEPPGTASTSDEVSIGDNKSDVYLPVWAIHSRLSSILLYVQCYQ